MERARSSWDAEHADGCVESNELGPRLHGGDITTQLNFLVNCFWLTALTTFAWLMWFAWHGFSAWHVTLVAIWGPVLMSAFHGLAVGEVSKEGSNTVSPRIVKQGVGYHNAEMD